MAVERHERYQRLKLLGKGMMSVVWLAHDTLYQDLVALKIMTTIAEDDQRNRKLRERFHREIEIASSLYHPHILPIIDYGSMLYEGRSVPFLVSPYIPEGSLAELIEERPPWLYWSLAQTADAINQAAESLWYLHTRHPQIVHQDVKPANFLYHSVQSERRAVYLYLCDFGISRWLRQDAAYASELLGTFAFIAPEQIRRRINCASDQYALAIMACYLLTGKLPLQAATNELYMQAHLEEAPLLPGQLNPERIHSPEVDAVIKRALAKDPQRRFPTILAFSEALTLALEHAAQKEQSRPLVSVAPIRAIASEQKQIASVAPAAIAASAVSAGSRLPVASSAAPAVQFEPAGPIVIDALNTEEDAVLDEPLPSRPARGALLSQQDQLQQDASTRFPLHSPVRLRLPARPRTLSWSPDGNALACTCYGHVPLVIKKHGAIQEIGTVDAQQAVRLAWSPDSRVLVVASRGMLRFWDVATQAELPPVLFPALRSLEGMSWSAQGELAVWGGGNVQVYTLSPAQLNETRSLLPRTISAGSISALVWSPDGAYLAIGTHNGAVVCRDGSSLELVWQAETTGQKVYDLNWSPDGSLLVAAFRNNRVAGWDVRNHHQVVRWERLPALPRMVSLALSHHIVVASAERRLLLGRPGETAPGASFPGQLLAAWSPTRPQLATLDEQQETLLILWQA
ncbi:MAG: protein kinase [Ktedonobacteraceae bacterium]|nr:protein kinase [Ktedonobacteraceae bacterium]